MLRGRIVTKKEHWPGIIPNEELACDGRRNSSSIFRQDFSERNIYKTDQCYEA